MTRSEADNAINKGTAVRDRRCPTTRTGTARSLRWDPKQYRWVMVIHTANGTLKDIPITYCEVTTNE